jgi:uracil-DNA glycosylase
MTEAGQVKLDPSWMHILGAEFSRPYMLKLRQFLLTEKKGGKVIYPRGSEYFNALDSTPFDQVKVVILGQDPYHGPGQAHGLCFSVQKGVQLPPSLQNIFKEIQQEYPDHTQQFSHGNLSGWARQGVLLLNAVLTVEHARAASHQGQGWEAFTDQVVTHLSNGKESLVFMLWGSYAQKKGAVIDTSKHLVLKSPHPSPLSAHRGFFGNNHFRQCNDYLVEKNKTPIDWFRID